MQEFSEEIKQRVNKVLTNSYYSKQNGYFSLESLSDFKALPTLRKTDIVDEENPVMFGEEYKDLAQEFNYTSGTTKHPTMILLSDKDLEVERQKVETLIDNYAGKRNYVVISSSIARRGYLSVLRQKNLFAGYSAPYNLGFSKQAVENLEIDTLWSTPSIALKLGDLLEGYEGIENIVLTGEPLSELAEKKLDELFSGVDIYMDYGSIETGHLGYQCEHLKGTDSYHLFEDKFYFEILDFESEEMVRDGYGELTVTKIWENCYAPLIRYRLGDKAKWKESDCGCSALTVEMKGRTVFDSFKLSGFTLYKQKFERALDPVADLIGTTYQIHIREVDVNNQIKPKLEIHLKPSSSLDKNLVDEKELGEDISSNFQVTENNSYKEMVQKGIFAELEVILKDSVVDGAKTKPIIDHRS